MALMPKALAMQINWQFTGGAGIMQVEHTADCFGGTWLKSPLSTEVYHRFLLRTGLPHDNGPITLIILFLVLHFNFLFVPCGGLSWLPVSFSLHVKYTLSYRIVYCKLWMWNLNRILTEVRLNVEARPSRTKPKPSAKHSVDVWR